MRRGVIYWTACGAALVLGIVIGECGLVLAFLAKRIKNPFKVTFN